MKRISAILLFVFVCNIAFAQTGENKKSSFQVSFISPIGTNGRYSTEYTNDYSLNLLVGISKDERRFTQADTAGRQAAGGGNLRKGRCPSPVVPHREHRPCGGKTCQ